MSGFAFHPAALNDLEDLWEFIAADNLDAADRVLEKLLDVIQSLAAFPDQGHHRPDLSNRSLRFIRCYDYLIAYAPDERPLWIVAVIHGRRNPRLLAGLLREREQ